MVVICAIVLYLCYTDIRFRKIPNAVLICLCMWMLFLRFLFIYTHHMHQALTSLIFDGCLGVVFFITLSVCELFMRRYTGHMCLGFGDIKYITVWICFLGVYELYALVCACFFALLYACALHKQTYAFGPWIGFSSLAFCFIRLVS